MSFNIATLKAMRDEGLSLDACIRVLETAESKADTTADKRRAWDRERKAEKRAEDRALSGGNPPDCPPEKGSNDIDILTSQNVKNSEPKGSSKKPNFSAPPNVPDEVWRDFLNSPKRRKAGMNATAYAGIKANLVILAEHGFPPGEMIALAVERGWTTVKLEWVLNDQNRNQRNERSQPSPLDQLVAASFSGSAGNRENPPPGGSDQHGCGGSTNLHRIGSGRA